MRKFPHKYLAAMIALKALPGSVKYDGDDQKIIESALHNLDLYLEVGVDSVVLENDHDVPYTHKPIPQEALDLVVKISKEVRRRFTNRLVFKYLWQIISNHWKLRTRLI